MEVANLIASAAATFFAGIILFMLKDIRSSMDRAAERVQKMEVDLVKNYVPREELADIIEGIVRGLKS